jgi:hypothetical protein
MTTDKPQNNNRIHRTVVVACRVMEPELERIREGSSRVEIRYLDQALHRTPQDLSARAQRQIDEASEYAAKIVLGYGLCSNGIVGITARKQGLIIPRCHDCIALFLGSPSAYKWAFEKRPGTYYLTPGWVSEKKDPLGIVEEDYMLRLDRETAMWVMEEELKHYTHIALIDAGVDDLSRLRERALKNAQTFKKTYEEIKGNLEYFKKIVLGPYTDPSFFLHIKPHETVTQKMFLR